MRLAALALDLDEDWFEDKIDRHVTAMRINHYPPQPVAPPEGQIRAGAHTDFGTFTILMGEDEPGGLQVQDRDGVWYDVETRPEAFVVNVGDLFRRWTNDVWTSNFHRVVNPPAEIGPERAAHLDRILPPAQLRRRDRLPADLHRRGAAAPLPHGHVGRIPRHPLRRDRHPRHPGRGDLIGGTEWRKPRP